ncbi:hypothetical protein BWK59_01250 [Flavobacterium davisii]|uniref:Glycosyltransferase 2-like domain-containing protein n=1 Tax=Flavobacterium davisii TaxID=2906077 RepID=A0A2D0AIW9_9FLAO|nr:glycosyltransferase [Flavobacterium davisii]OWP85197.1 hypothetical protein BWK59_01250 [Flavobacterium davisii]
MENKPLLSIAIATKNREKYCIESIKSILLLLNNDDIEITVADNSDTEQVKIFVEEINHPSIKYIYDNGSVSSIENFNRAMELTTGEYVMLIGDDDTILPSAIDIAKWAKYNNVDSVCCKKTITYFWPNAHPRFPKGLLKIPKIEKDKKIKIDPNKELVNLLEGGLVNYMFYNVPKSYHGIVKKSIMDEIKRITGNYYGALSPDIFSVVAISLISKNHYIINNPITIAGVCPSSTTSAQIKGAHAGLLKDMPHFKNRKEKYTWSSKIPEFYSVTTTWGDSGLNALRSMGRSDYEFFFNVYPLIAQSILMNRSTILSLVIRESEILRKKLEKNFIEYWSLTIFAAIKLILDKVVVVLKNNIDKEGKKEGIENFEQLFEYLNKNKKNNL